MRVVIETAIARARCLVRDLGGKVWVSPQLRVGAALPWQQDEEVESLHVSFSGSPGPGRDGQVAILRDLWESLDDNLQAQLFSDGQVGLNGTLRGIKVWIAVKREVAEAFLGRRVK